jgi:hypothetical protein
MYVAAYLKVFRMELRSACKFVRNEYAHNLVDMSREECLAILGRYSGILTTLDELRKQSS